MVETGDFYMRKCGDNEDYSITFISRSIYSPCICSQHIKSTIYIDHVIKNLVYSAQSFLRGPW